MNKSKRKLIIPSLLTILGCIAIGTGSTYSLFTSSSENNITISSGKVSVTSTASLLKTYSLKDGAVAETSTLGSFETGGTATLNGGSLELKNIVPGDKVEFKVTIKNEATISAKYRTSFLYSDDTGLFGGLNISVKENETETHNTIFVDKWADLSNTEKELTISIELPETAGNEYMDKSCKLNFKVEAVQGNGNVKDDTVVYTLDDFNKLDSLDKNIKNVYLLMGEQTLDSSDVHIGKYSKDESTGKVTTPLKDTYTQRNIANSNDYINGEAVTSSNIKEGTVLDNGSKVVTELDNNYYYVSTNKTPLNMYISGKVKSKEAGSVNASLYAICFHLPDDSVANFTGLYVEGGFRVIGGDLLTGDGVSNNYGKMKEINFKGTNFNGNWIQNSNIYAKNITLDGVTFENHINTSSKNDSNPVWIQNLGIVGESNYYIPTNVTVKNSTINGYRPLKFFDGSLGAANFTFENNTFNMTEYITKDGDEYKNCGIYLGGSIHTNSTGTAKITIKNNTLKSGTALIAFANENTMSSGVTFDVSDNKDSEGKALSNEKLSVTWKGTTYHAIPTTSSD